jgi:hypothetical protein
MLDLVKRILYYFLKKKFEEAKMEYIKNSELP